MTGFYELVDVRPDTDPWLELRRQSVGASDVPAIMGLSPHRSPLDVYRSKFGQDRPMDPELALIGHAEEFTVGRLIRRFRPDLGVLRRGFMARSLTTPVPMHATFDRFVVRREQGWRPVQIKTANAFTPDDWEGGPPLAVLAQVQAELAVHGSERGYVAALVGGRDFHVHPVDRDDAWIRDLMLPQVETFWREHVEAQVPPDPISSAEAVSLWPGDGSELVADAELLQLLADYRAARHNAKTYEAGAEEYALEIKKRMRDATALVSPNGGDVLATWKPTRATTYTVNKNAGRQFRLKGEA